MLLSSIKSLVVLCWVLQVQADDAEENAATRLRQLYCTIIRDEKLAGKPIIGVSIGGFDVGHTKITDAGLVSLLPLKNLAALHAINSKLTDNGLKDLAPLKSLTFLDLGSSRVTNAGLKELQKSLPNCYIVEP